VLSFRLSFRAECGRHAENKPKEHTAAAFAELSSLISLGKRMSEAFSIKPAGAAVRNFLWLRSVKRLREVRTTAKIKHGASLEPGRPTMKNKETCK